MPGNVTDVSALTRATDELKADGVGTEFAVLDAGYYTGSGADALPDAGISFITRVKSNLRIYRQTVKEHLSSLENEGEVIKYNKRFILIKCVSCRIGRNNDRPAYAYLCKDLARRNMPDEALASFAEDENFSGSDIFDAMREHGVFILISSIKIANDKILPLYAAGYQTEEIFKVCRQEGEILPLNAEKEETFRGRLMLTFIAAAISGMMSEPLKKTTLTTESVFAILHDQPAYVYDDLFITMEPTKSMNEAYKAFDIQCPETTER